MAGLLGIVTILLGIVGWVVKSGMSKMTTALENSTAQMVELLHRNDKDHVAIAARLKHMQEGHKVHERESREACPLTDVHVDKMLRAATRMLGPQNGPPGVEP